MMRELPAPNVPRWLRHGGFHTVVGGLPPRGWRARRDASALLDGSDFMELDGGDGIRLSGYYTPGTGNTLAIVIHGWEGSAASAYVVSASQALQETGCAVFRLQLRDHGDTHALNESPFLGSEHTEVLNAISDIQRQHPTERTVVVGFSLGGNFAVRVAAFARTAGVSVDQAVAVCPPIRPGEAARSISASGLFNRYFAWRWQRSIRLKLAAFPRWEACRPLLNIDDIMAMHEAFVPRFTRFANADAYFDDYALSPENLPSLDCPVELLLAADDPVCPVASARHLARLPGLSCTVVPHGGHCAFLDGIAMTSWVDRYLANAVVGLAGFSADQRNA